MTSTRLPGKVLKPVLGKPLLEYQLERLKRVQEADNLVVATTENETDDPVIALCQSLAVQTIRGSEHDVLGRYFQAAEKSNAHAIVRITADCPLIDPQVVDSVIACYREDAGQFDYVANVLERTYPRGMDTEVFSFAALETAFKNAMEPADREHVTRYFYQNPNQFRMKNIPYYKDTSQHRWTVDTIEDFQLVEKIFSELYPKNPEFTLEETLSLLEKHPDWAEINCHIEQKAH